MRFAFLAKLSTCMLLFSKRILCPKCLIDSSTGKHLKNYQIQNETFRKSSENFRYSNWNISDMSAPDVVNMRASRQ